MKTIANSLVKISTAVCAGILVVALSGCLVGDDDDLKIRKINTSIYRIIQDGDFLEYRIAGTRTPPGVPTGNSVTGKLTIDYDFINIPAAYGLGAPIPVIRETSHIVIDKFIDETVIRYLQQDTTVGSPTEGTLYLVGYPSPTVGQPWYVTQHGILNPLQNAAPVEIVKSPAPTEPTLPTGDGDPVGSGDKTYNFTIMDDCVNSPSCNSIVGSISDTINFIDIGDPPTAIQTYDTSTDFARFETIGYTYNMLFIDPYSDNQVLDARMFCDANGIQFDGVAYVYPAVGIVYYEMTSCNPSPTNPDPSTYFIIATLSGTNIPLPSAD